MKGMPGQEDDPARITQAAMDYVDGFYSSDPERIKKGVHQSLHKVVARTLPNKREFFQRMDQYALVQFASIGMGKTPEDKRNIKVELLDRVGNMAAVAIPSGNFYDLAQVALINGKWQIVNVLWSTTK